MRTPVLGLLLLASLLLPLAAAHGAPSVREIEERILADGTDPNGTDYGTTPEGAPLFYEGGHDILALDIREARNATNGEPILLFRLVNQGGDPTQGELIDVLHFTAAGTDHILVFRTTDNIVYAGENFDEFTTIDIGDAHVTGAEGGVYYSTLGVTVGDVLTDIWVEGSVGGTAADHMPGGYFFAEQQVGEASSDGRGSYTLAGPRELLDSTTQPSATEGAIYTFSTRVKNPLTLLTQFVTAELRTNSSEPIEGNATQVILGPGDEREIAFSLNVADAIQGFDVTLRSDLGDHVVTRQALSDAELLDATVVDTGTVGQDANDSALARGERYAYRFDTPGQWSLIGRSVGERSFPVNVSGADPNELLVVLHVVGETLGGGGELPVRVAVGGTVLFVNEGHEPLSIVEAPPPMEDSDSTPAPGVLLVIAALATGALRRLRR